MRTCRHCHQELTEGFDFCHHCGAAVEDEPAGSQDSMQHVVEVVDQIKTLSTQAASAGTNIKTSVDRLLGNPISTQRLILYSLLTALTLVSFRGLNPITDGPFHWLQYLLVSAILFLPFIYYQVTGLIPLSNVANLIAGDVYSLRRRLLLTLLWMLGPTFIMAVGVALLFGTLFSGDWSWASPSQWATSSTPATAPTNTPGANTGQDWDFMIQGLTMALGSFLFNFYLMGFASSWRPLSWLGDQVFLPRLSHEIDRAAARIQESIEADQVRGLTITAVPMASLRRYTAGESTGTQGQQLVVTHGRSRVLLFVRDHGDGLFVRWTCYFDASGRRLFVLFGLVFSTLLGLFERFTNVRFLEMVQSFFHVLAPTAGSRTSVLMHPGGFFSRLFCLAEGLSEYTQNDLFALDASVRENVRTVLEEIQAAHNANEEIRFGNRVFGNLEGGVPGQGMSGQASSLGAGGRV